MTHLYKIKTKEGELKTFTPNVIQLKHLAERGSHRYNRILKARQHGMTTLYCIDLLDEALWVPGTTCAIIAHEQKALVKIFQTVKRAFENLPPSIKPLTRADNKNEYEFTNRFDGAVLDSSIYVALKIRSGTVQNLHITEIAYIKDKVELAAGSKQTVPLTGRISEETTANGMEDFYDSFMEARKNPNPTEMDYRPYFYAWFENPEYTLHGILEGELTGSEKLGQKKWGWSDGQILWRRWKMKELLRNNQGFGLSGEQLFKQEYPSTILEAFQSGAGSVFNLEKLDAITPKPPLTKEQVASICLERQYDPSIQERAYALMQKGVRIWHMPVFGQEYVAGVDPSDGQGSDNGAIDIWTRGEVPEQVAQFYGLHLPDDLAELTREMCEFYNKAFVGVENNMISTILFLSKIYDNYYSKVTIDEKIGKKTKKIGWNTNIQTREKMIDDFLIHFAEDAIIINSDITLKEMRTFVKKEMKSGAYKREHADGRHDDSLFAAMIAIQMTLYRKPQARAFLRD